MKAIGIVILTLLLTLSTFSTAGSTADEPVETYEVFTLDYEETYPTPADIEDDKHYYGLFHASEAILTDKIEQEEQTYFHDSSFSLLKPPKTLFA